MTILDALAAKSLNFKVFSMYVYIPIPNTEIS